MTIDNNDLLFAKVKPEAIIPTKRDEDAGYDIYACFDEDFIYFKPHETKLISTGIACAMSSDYYMQLDERGSTAIKGVKKSAGIIDSGFRNEIFVAICNINDKPLVIAKDYVTSKDIFGEIGLDYVIYPYSKAIAQGIIHRVYKMDIKEVKYEDLLTIHSERGVGQLGSSKK
jgi:dUTP pyrophosphatase